jgi:hypothetical protein
MVPVKDWALAVDKSSLSQQILTVEAQPKHWSDVAGKHVSLRL